MSVFKNEEALNNELFKSYGRYGEKKVVELINKGAKVAASEAVSNCYRRTSPLHELAILGDVAGKLEVFSVLLTSSTMAQQPRRRDIAISTNSAYNMPSISQRTKPGQIMSDISIGRKQRKISGISQLSSSGTKFTQKLTRNLRPQKKRTSKEPRLSNSKSSTFTSKIVSQHTSSAFTEQSVQSIVNEDKMMFEEGKNHKKKLPINEYQIQTVFTGSEGQDSSFLQDSQQKIRYFQPCFASVLIAILRSKVVANDFIELLMRHKPKVRLGTLLTYRAGMSADDFCFKGRNEWIPSWQLCLEDTETLAHFNDIQTLDGSGRNQSFFNDNMSISSKLSKVKNFLPRRNGSKFLTNKNKRQLTYISTTSSDYSFSSPGGSNGFDLRETNSLMCLNQLISCRNDLNFSLNQRRVVFIRKRFYESYTALYFLALQYLDEIDENVKDRIRQKMQIFVQAGADINEVKLTKKFDFAKGDLIECETVFHLAIRRNSLPLLKILLDLGVDFKLPKLICSASMFPNLPIDGPKMPKTMTNMQFGEEIINNYGKKGAIDPSRKISSHKRITSAYLKFLSRNLNHSRKGTFELVHWQQYISQQVVSLELKEHVKNLCDAAYEKRRLLEHRRDKIRR
eukprot:maker-scaffold_36-snap-gene-0.1-mRNA-1 protein AED:0.03 eAED:0.03 QI:244/0/0.5/1/1/1/2/0/623